MEKIWKKYEEFVSIIVDSLSRKVGEKYNHVKISEIIRGREFDIVCENENSYLYIECKNYEKERIDSPKIEIFAYKVERIYNMLEAEAKANNQSLKKIYAFVISSSGFTNGVYQFFTNIDPIYKTTGHHINFHYLPFHTYNNGECALGYEISSAKISLMPFLLKQEFTPDKLIDLLSLQLSDEITFEQRISTCIRLWYHRNNVNEKWYPIIFDRLSDALYNMNRSIDALLIARELKSMPNLNEKLGLGAEHVEGISMVKSKMRIRKEIINNYYKWTQIDDSEQRIRFMILLGNALANTDIDESKKMYLQASKDNLISPYMKFITQRKLYHLSDPINKNNYFEDYIKAYDAVCNFYGDKNVGRIKATEYMKTDKENILHEIYGI